MNFRITYVEETKMDDKMKRGGNTSESSKYEVISDKGSTIGGSTAQNIISSGDKFEFAENHDDQGAAAISDDVVSKRSQAALGMIRRSDFLLGQREFLRQFEARPAPVNAELARLNAAVDDLSKKLNEAKEERAEMGRRLEYFEKSREKSDSLIAELREQKPLLKDEVDLLAADSENVKGEAKRLSDEAKIAQESAAAEKEGLLRELREQKKTWIAEVAEKNEQIMQLQEKVRSLEGDLNALQLEGERLKLANVELQQQSVQELARAKSELDQATVRNSDITNTAVSLANQNRANELRELKLREEGLLNDISKLKQENVTLQKQLRSVESVKIDLKNKMEQETKRFSEEAERVRSQLEEEKKLKQWAQKEMEKILREERTKSGQLEADLAKAKKELQAAREPQYSDQILLAVGGYNPGDVLTGSIEAYDPKIRSWTKLNISDPNGHRAGHGCVILSGEMWTIGGYNAGDLNSVRKLNLVTKEWSDGAPMNHCRRFVSVAHHNGHIWAMGGCDADRMLSTAERYDPNDCKWSYTISPLSVPRSGAHATVCSDKIYIAGGYDGNNWLDSVEYYDAATDRRIVLTAPMKHGRALLGCASLDGVIYVVGGMNEQKLSSVERYDPRTGRWEQLSDMSVARIFFGIECVDGKIIVAGGHNGNTEIAECEYYEPRTNSWAPLTPMKEERGGLYCVAVDRMESDIF